MRMEEVDARKAYIQKVRKSFDSPERSYEFEKGNNTKGEAEEGFSFFKIRLLVAVLLFAAYVFCDRTGTFLYGYSAKDVAEEIAQDLDYQKAGEEIVQAFHQMMQSK